MHNTTNVRRLKGKSHININPFVFLIKKNFLPKPDASVVVALCFAGDSNSVEKPLMVLRAC